MMLALDVQPSAYADAYLLKSLQFDNPSQQIPYLGNLVTSQPINLGDRNNPSLETLTLLITPYGLVSSVAPSVIL